MGGTAAPPPFSPSPVGYESSFLTFPVCRAFGADGAAVVGSSSIRALDVSRNDLGPETWDTLVSFLMTTPLRELRAASRRTDRRLMRAGEAGGNTSTDTLT